MRRWTLLVAALAAGGIFCYPKVKKLIEELDEALTELFTD